MHQSILLLASTLLQLTCTNAQATIAPDGVIVPFTSGLPPCATKCGKLYDVQGACTPPQLATTSISCFCSDARTSPIAQSGTEGAAAVCVNAGCSDADLLKIQSWYDGFCGLSGAAATTSTSSTRGTAASTSTSTSSASNKGSSGSTNNTWIGTHWKWVIMLVVLVVAIVGGWIIACIFRKRYLSKKEREFELRPPVVAWGPHQMHGAMHGAMEPAALRGTPGQAETGQLGRSKEVSKEHSSEASAVPAKRESKGWLKKSRV
ncbi:hypothetical protein B7494_g3586 [Chlorociboria aeruginascens]|nr:hypothetical protein B7494_g3586 [Chlorociboria aeruginascens]